MHQPLAALLCCLTLSCAEPPHEQPEQAHEASSSAIELYALPGLDHGLIQSPVNILTSTAKTEHRIHTIVVNDNHVKAVDVANTGHSIQVDFALGSTVEFDGKSYELKQCHFHTPSEHQVDGVTYPMEMHCVNTREPAAGADDAPEYLVFAWLFKMGAESHFISEFLSRVPAQPEAAPLEGEPPVYLEDLLKEFGGPRHYFFYKGSLTTPPYTETVSWVVHEEVFQASREQIQEINRIEGDNARHVQALNARSVEVQ